MSKLTDQERKNWRSHHIPGCSCIHTLKVNALFVSAANSEKHEMAKCRKAFRLMKQGHKIITEAVENKTNLRRDLVDITDGEIYEFENSKMKRGHRHPSNINVIFYDKEE